MGLVGVQAVMTAITTKLRTDLPAKVAALNSEYDDVYTITDVAHDSYYDHVVNPFALKCTWPAIVLLDGGRRRDAEQSNFAMHVFAYAVTVDVIVRGKDADELTQKLRRYERAVVEILSVRHALAATCTSCVFDASGGAEFTDESSGDLLQDRALRFIVTTAEVLA